MKFEDFDPSSREPAERESAVPEQPVSESQLQAERSQPASVRYAEPPGQLPFAVMQKNLNDCLMVVDNEVTKDYLPSLQRCQVVPADVQRIAALEPVQFFRISRLVYQENEFSVDKLATIFNTLTNKLCTLVLMIHSDGKTNDFYLGVRAQDGKRYSTGTMRQMLEQSLVGLFPGSDISNYYKEELDIDLQRLDRSGCVSSVTCVADYKQEREAQTDRDFIQGLEKFVDSMQGRAFTAVCIANNLTRQELVQTRQSYEQIYTSLSPFANMQYRYGINASSSQSRSDTQTSGQSQTSGRSSSTGTSRSSSQGQTSGSSASTTRTDTNGTSLSEGDTTGRTSIHTVGRSDGTSESTTTTVTGGVNGGGNFGTTTGVSGGIGINTGQILGAVGTIAGLVGSVAAGPLGLVASSLAGGIGSTVGQAVGAVLPQVHLGRSAGTYQGVSGGVSASVARGRTRGTSHTDTVSDAEGTSESHSRTVGTSRSTSQGVTEGTSQSTSRTDTVGSSLQYGESESLALSASLAQTLALSDTSGNSQDVTLNIQNKKLLNILNRLDHQMERLDECESIGMWDFAAYFLGETAAEAETAANMYRSLVSGSQSGVQLSAVNTWTAPDNVKAITQYVTHFVHPEFIYTAPDAFNPRPVVVDATALVSTNELAIQLGLPRHSVKGLPVIEHAAFAQEVLQYDAFAGGSRDEGQKLRIGQVNHLGHDTETPVTLDVQSLSMHTFVTGSTGAGKSNAVYKMLEELLLKQVHFLVIEPAKGEYKMVFGGQSDVTVLGTNPALARMLQIDPFSFPEGIHIYEHLDRLVELFNVCWPMYAAMPAVLKDAVEQAYEQTGWDLQRSENRYGARIFPTFQNVLEKVDAVMDESQYSAENKSDYKGSLCTRLRSLITGINSMIFTPDELSSEQLFDQNVIVDLSRIGSSETKSLIMGVLVMKLQEYRMASARNINVPLKHVTVLEEAHNLLRKTSYEQGSESANLQGKSVEMLTNAIAEMRTYGEGFIIADQAPGLLDPAVVRNTNTKVIFRLPDQGDRELVGYAANLNKEQVAELARLPRGVAAIYQNEWLQPVLCKFYRANHNEACYHYVPAPASDARQKEFRASMLGLLLQNCLPEMEKKDLDLHKLRQQVSIQNIPIAAKINYLRWIEEYDKNGTLELWNTKHLSELSTTVTVLLDCRKEVNDLLEQNTDPQTLDQQLRKLIESRVDGLQSAGLNEVVQWVLWSCCEETNRTERYRVWKRFQRGEKYNEDRAF